MPKDRRGHSVSSDKSRSSPYKCSSSRSKHSLSKNPLESEKNLKEWEEARCPVCMEHPHNAILLLCSSHEKGCHPYMCDTSYRHSNCFDQFQKSSSESLSTMLQQEITMSMEESLSHMMGSEETSTNLQVGRRVEGSTPTHVTSCENEVKPKLVCPLCRGQINGWVVVQPARHFMNAKSRSCACETCDYSGTYTDLRKHARLVHPLVRPSEVDPERQRNWSRLEQQRDFADLLSSLQFSIDDERSEERALSLDPSSMFTVVFLVRFLRPQNSSSGNSLGGSNVRTLGTIRSRWWRTSSARATESSSRENEYEPSDDGSIHQSPASNDDES